MWGRSGGCKVEWRVWGRVPGSGSHARECLPVVKQIAPMLLRFTGIMHHEITGGVCLCWWDEHGGFGAGQLMTIHTTRHTIMQVLVAGCA